jgi:nicotinate-nucleotide adenylyltransferase
MKIGLFFGSFNPVHNAHVTLAQYMLDNTDLECIWFVISPQNPLKDKESLLSEKERLKMVNMAIVNNDKMRASDIEFKLSKPSYTCDTLNLLKKTFKDDEFVLIIGTDNLENLHKWKDYKNILEDYKIYVYPRNTKETISELKNHPNVKIFNVDLIDISSSCIRQAIKENREVVNLLAPQVEGYIKRKGFYR